jgi:hypothetical protein
MLQALKANMTSKFGYELKEIEIPPQMRSQEEFEYVESIGQNIVNGMLLTLVIPLVFNIFMSVSMNKVWSLYNLL